MHADRANRVILLLIGLLALVAGTLGLVAGFGGFGPRLQHQHLYDNEVSRYIGRNGVWLWVLAAVAGLVLLLLALRWLYALLFSTDRADTVAVRNGSNRKGHAARTAGRTLVLPAAISDAVTDEIRDYRGVAAARARVLGAANSPRLVVHVSVARDADIAALRDRIDQGALAHTRTALDRPDLPIQLDITVADTVTGLGR